MEAAGTCVTLVNFYQIIRCCSPEDSHLLLLTNFQQALEEKPDFIFQETFELLAVKLVVEKVKLYHHILISYQTLPYILRV
jgi:hypothetical protein